jgi:cytochrome c oxidase subunit 3
LLLVVLMTFGALFAAYVVISTNKVQEWQPFALPAQFWLSTFLILTSSVVYFLAERAIAFNFHSKGKRYLLITTFLGAAFISSQLLVWFELSRRGLYVYGNPYAGFFFILTAVHAVHVVGGITALSSVLLKSWQPAENENEIERRKSLANVVGWYWHFMGLLWIVIFLLLGFWT